MASLRVATFQRFPKFGDVAGVGESLLRDLTWADARRVDLSLFPECYLQGYVLDRPTLSRTALALERDEQFRSLLTKLAPIRSTLILGLVERDGELVFNAAAVIRHGSVLGKYRKTHLLQ
jgi:predicted amidohydrolase